MAMKQTVAEKRKAPLMLRTSNMKGNSLMERNKVMDLRTEVMEEAGPRTEAGYSSENRIQVTGPMPRV